MTTTNQLAGGTSTEPRQRSGPAMGFVLSHEQFPAPRLVEYGVAAERAGFDMVWTSDHFQMPILLEHMVVVGGQEEAARGAELWRFLPKGWKPGFFNNISPTSIRENAEGQIPLEQVYGQWAVSTDPDEHIKKIQELVDKGLTHIFVHSAQPDQVAVVDFFGQHVLPRIKQGAVTGVRAVTA